jgi:hypothetical protein
MKVEEWLKDLEYDSDGICITKNRIVVLDIKGWFTLVDTFNNENLAAVFQDEIGKFVLEAINEKLKNDKFKKKILDKIEKDLIDNSIE